MMAQSWDEQFIRAKYHLNISRRLFENFENYETKRFLSGTLSEMAKSAACVVNAYLAYSHATQGTRMPVDPKARLNVFEKASNKDIGTKLTKDILTVFIIRRAQKDSPVELLKKDKILLLDNGQYRALTKERLKELLDGIDLYCRRFTEVTKTNTS